LAIKAKAARGVLWSLVEYGGGEGISFLVFLVLARLVAPESFGVVALAGVFIMLVQVFLWQGFPDAIVQRQELRPEHIDTAFWTNMAIALAFLGITQASAGPLARLFDQPLLEGVLRWLSLVFLTTSLISTHQAVFKREFRFKAFAIRSLAGIGTGGVVGVAMAASGYGVWSLVGQQLGNGVASVVAIWLTSDWRPHMRFCRRALTEMAGFSAHVIGSNLVGFCYKRLDVFLLGLFLEAKHLGYYYLVQRLIITIGLVTLSTVQSIVMPVLSRKQDDPEKFREIFVFTVGVVQSLWLPSVVGLGLVAPFVIPAVFGPQWQPATPLLQVMCLVGFTHALTFFSGPALWAKGRADAHFRLSLVQILLTIAVFLPAAASGRLMLVAVAFFAVSVVIVPFHLHMLRRVAGIPAGDLLRAVLPACVAGAVMVVVVEALVPVLPPGWRASWNAVALAGVGAVVYLGCLAVLAPHLLRQVSDLVREALSRREAAPPPAPGGLGGTASSAAVPPA
jgi:O-antigen/teichoic acid export membrane protein